MMFRKSDTRYADVSEVISDRGFLVFDNTSDVIQAEMILKKEGISIRVMGPPPEIQKGCDMVIEFPLNQELAITRLLKRKYLEPIDIVPVFSPLLKPVDLFHVKDFGQHLMVRCANMKITADKRTLEIVNVSGGGCPDVPYLARLMVGKKITDAPEPLDYGSTLCGYTLQLAFDELKRLCSL